MAETPSNMLPLGTKAPGFSLPDVCSNKTLSLEELKSDIATVIMFICNHCPYVKHIEEKLIKIAKEYQSKGVAFIAINSNDVQKYPMDGPLYMRREAESHDFTFPYLFDESQDIARAYQAACTPDFFIFDKDLKCVYRGQFDESRPNNQKPVTGEDLKNALDAIIDNKEINSNQVPSVGCNIKWKR